RARGPEAAWPIHMECERDGDKCIERLFGYLRTAGSSRTAAHRPCDRTIVPQADAPNHLFELDDAGVGCCCRRSFRSFGPSTIKDPPQNLFSVASVNSGGRHYTSRRLLRVARKRTNNLSVVCKLKCFRSLLVAMIHVEDCQTCVAHQDL